MSYDARETGGTPWGAPLVPVLPLRMRDTEILTVFYRTDPGAAERLLPTSLALLDPLVIVHLYRMHDAEWFGAYGESAVQLPVRHEASGTEGAYSPLLFVESDGAVAAGRDDRVVAPGSCLGDVALGIAAFPGDAHVEPHARVAQCRHGVADAVIAGGFAVEDQSPARGRVHAYRLTVAGECGDTDPVTRPSRSLRMIEGHCRDD